MLCSERELGISDNHDGLMELPADAPVGVSIIDYLNLDDAVIDLDLTPNRSDCLGMAGLAREVGVLNNIDIKVPSHVSDEEYLQRVEEQFVPRAIEFRPELIFWNFGYDGTQGEYGDIGLTMDCHPRLAKVFEDAAERACQGRLVVVLCGGTGRRVAAYTIPKIINCLAG